MVNFTQSPAPLASLSVRLISPFLLPPCNQAIHVRKVWSPPTAATVSSLPLAPAGSVSAGGAVVSSPSSDPELKKAYFRQLEEIQALQDQLQLKERRIAQLEAELSRVSRDRDVDPLQAGESNC
ncbi:coronin-2B-like isoform X4 [Elysia marginata]|uniref:Coronin-2B-like isoform X4 n=1 Tax=Elysia marginata TaxID=1093978 RepID=A0AAV4GTF6_9GAST|nr:coronin-2B-like isoform X4 [Elysia marginata]